MSRPSQARPVVRTGAALVSASALLVGAALSATPATAAAAPLPATAGSTGTLTVPVSGDGYTVPTVPTRLTGAYKVLRVGTSTSDTRTAFFRFDVSGLPSGAVDVQATLAIEGSGKATVGKAVAEQVTAYQVPSTWTEATLSAASAPALGAVAGSAAAPLAGAYSQVPVGSVANGPASFAVRATGPAGSALSLVSRETSAQSASLTVTYRVPATGTIFGESVMQGSATWTDAVAAADVRYGRSAIDRVYYGGLPVGWPGNAGTIGRSVIVSFKAPPSQVLSGTLDASLTSWFATAPSDREIYWSYYHEPEDNIAAGEFTAADYRAAWAHLATLARAVGNTHLHATLILMGWTLLPASGRTVSDYYPGSSVIDVAGWDVYTAQGKYTDPTTVFAPAVAQSAAWGKPVGFAEWGAALVAGDPGAGRAAWVTGSAAYMRSAGAVFSTYFDSTVGGPYQLTDAASIAAYHAVVSGS